jgi:hypothetical protein
MDDISKQRMQAQALNEADVLRGDKIRRDVRNHGLRHIGKTRKISTATQLFGSALPARKDFFYMMVRQKKTIINIAHIAVQGW